MIIYISSANCVPTFSGYYVHHMGYYIYINMIVVMLGNFS